MKYFFLSMLVLFTSCSQSPQSSSDSNGVTVDCNISNELAPSLSSILDTYVSTYRPVGLAVAISSSKFPLAKYYSGWSNRENNTAVSSETLWHSMSQGKSYTVAAFLELFERGDVNLDDPLSSFGVNIPNHGTFGAPTLRMAMNHSTLLERPFNTKLLDPNFLQTSDPSNTRTKHVADAVALGYLSTSNCCSSGQSSSDFGDTFTMGTTVYYSDANTVALSLALENITGKSWGESIHDLVLNPWGLDNTFLINHDIPENPTSYNTPYLRSKRYANYASDNTQAQITFSEQFVDYATGGGTSYATLCDFIDFSEAFYEGNELSNAAKTEQRSYLTLPGGGVHYGLGTQGFPLLGAEQEIIAHFGGGPGGGGVVAYNPKNDTHIAIMTNYSFPDNEMATLLLDLLSAIDLL